MLAKTAMQTKVIIVIEIENRAKPLSDKHFLRHFFHGPRVYDNVTLFL